jgi:hypothetical protein
MTDGFQPEYVDEPTCRICGVALADHPKVSELCRTVFTLAAKVQRIVAYETCTGEIECTCWVCLSERVKRQKGEIVRLRAERNALKDACHRNKRKWRHGWKRTLDEIVRGWKRACGEKDAEIERLNAEVDRLNYENAELRQPSWYWDDRHLDYAIAPSDVDEYSGIGDVFELRPLHELPAVWICVTADGPEFYDSSEEAEQAAKGDS